MARRHSSEAIPPFPEDIDRRDFGNYLSGLTDGEGCFLLRIGTQPQYSRKARKWYNLRKVMAAFTISLRVDDGSIIRLIRAFLRCGGVCVGSRRCRGSRSGPDSPQVILRVCRVEDLVKKIIPQFLACPLRAKKARDFHIWCQGVRIIDEVYHRPTCGLGHGMGVLPKWTERDFAVFADLAAALKVQRICNAPAVELPAPRPPAPEPPSLFDWSPDGG